MNGELGIYFEFKEYAPIICHRLHKRKVLSDTKRLAKAVNI